MGLYYLRINYDYYYYFTFKKPVQWRLSLIKIYFWSAVQSGFNLAKYGISSAGIFQKTRPIFTRSNIHLDHAFRKRSLSIQRAHAS